MARNATVASIITWIRTEAGLTGSTAVTDTELVALINPAWSELHDLLVAAYGPAFYAASGTFPTVAGQRAYTWPTIGGTGAACYEILGVDLTLAVGDVVSLDPIDFHHRNLGSGHSPWRSRLVRPFYRWHGGEIWLVPPPDAVYTITVHWVPCSAVLDAASTIDGINGWERYIVSWVIARLIEAEEGDPTARFAELAQLTKRIQAMAANRQADGPDQIVKRRRRRTGLYYVDD